MSISAKMMFGMYLHIYFFVRLFLLIPFNETQSQN